MAATFPAPTGLVIGPPAPRTRLGRQWRRIRTQLGRAFGLLGTVSVEGVQYREVLAEPLARALGRKGRGYKDYRVTFPSGSKMLIRATPRRIFADLSTAAPPLLNRYRRIQGLIVPGMRVLEFGCSTGYGAVWLAAQVGPSGAVVAIDEDDMAILFAQRRYPAANIAFETRRGDSLAGETDGAFDAVLAPFLITGEGSNAADLAELWRMVAPGGWLFLGAPVHTGSAADSRPAAPDRAALEALIRQTCTAPEPAQRSPGANTAAAAGIIIQFIGEPMDGSLDVLVAKPTPPAPHGPASPPDTHSSSPHA